MPFQPSHSPDCSDSWQAEDYSNHGEKPFGPHTIGSFASKVNCSSCGGGYIAYALSQTLAEQEGKAGGRRAFRGVLYHNLSPNPMKPLGASKQRVGIDVARTSLAASQIVAWRYVTMDRNWVMVKTHVSRYLGETRMAVRQT